jgi:hypothetical protein
MVTGLRAGDMCEPPVPDWSRLARVRYSRLDFEFEVTWPVLMPPFKGSALRGALGNAMRRMGVAVPAYEALYREVFETRVPKAVQSVLRTGENAPHPFVIEPPAGEETLLERGCSLQFRLVLFERAIGMASGFVQAFRFAGEEMGLGTVSGGRRGRCRLVSVSEDGAGLFRDGAMLRGTPAGRELVTETGSANTVALRFVTPASLPGAVVGHRGTAFSLHGFLRAAYRRCAQLGALWGASRDPVVDGEAYRDEVAAFLKAADACTLAAVDLREAPTLRRVSKYRGEVTPMNGVLGEVRIEGRPGLLLPLFRAVEVVHVGKWAAFGFGRVEVAAGHLVSGVDVTGGVS